MLSWWVVVVKRDSHEISHVDQLAAVRLHIFAIYFFHSCWHISASPANLKGPCIVAVFRVTQLSTKHDPTRLGIHFLVFILQCDHALRDCVSVPLEFAKEAFSKWGWFWDQHSAHRVRSHDNTRTRYSRRAFAFSLSRWSWVIFFAFILIVVRIHRIVAGAHFNSNIFISSSLRSIKIARGAFHKSSNVTIKLIK